MILSDNEILASADMIQPFYEEFLGPSSYDLRLNDTIMYFQPGQLLDVKNTKSIKYATKKLNEGEGFVLAPGEFILAETKEYVKMPDDIVARVEWKSSLGRLGLLVHVTAGFVDAGFEGTITLEIYNLNANPIVLYEGMKICQLGFQKQTSASKNPYWTRKGSKYQWQIGPRASQYEENFDMPDN